MCVETPTCASRTHARRHRQKKPPINQTKPAVTSTTTVTKHAQVHQDLSYHTQSKTPARPPVPTIKSIKKVLLYCCTLIHQSHRHAGARSNAIPAPATAASTNQNQPTSRLTNEKTTNHRCISNCPTAQPINRPVDSTSPSGGWRVTSAAVHRLTPSPPRAPRHCRRPLPWPPPPAPPQRQRQQQQHQYQLPRAPVPAAATRPCSCQREATAEPRPP